MSAQYYADLVPLARDRGDIEAIAADARRDGAAGQMVRTGDDEPREQLRAYLERKWHSLPAGDQEGSAA